MKNTLIELAKQSGMGVVNQYGLYIFKEDELERFAELLQANSGNAVDERVAFEAIFPPDWHCGFNEVENEYYLLKLDPSPSGKYTCDDAMRLFVQPQNDRWKVWQARASLANKPELRVYIEHDFVCVRTETGQLVDSKKLSDFKSNEFLAITKG